MNMFSKATKQQLKLRLLLEGPSGSGKTYSALVLAKEFGGKIAVIDTENDSAALYSDGFDFDRLNIEPPYTPEKYIDAIKCAEEMGYTTLIIDSVTHEWSGEGGCLDIQTQLGGRYQDWAKVTPRHQKFVETILRSRLHIIGTARTKADYAITNDGGKTKVTKLGTKTEQRDGLEYEFTLVLRLNQNNMFEASKDRTGLFKGIQDVIRPEHARNILNWLDSGENPVEQAIKEIGTCKTLDDLKQVWGSLSKSIKSNNEVMEYKDSLKEKLADNVASEDEIHNEFKNIAGKEVSAIDREVLESLI